MGDHLQKLVLLQSLSGHVKREVIRVYDTLDEAKVVGHHVLEVVGDEDSPDVELDVLLGLPVLVELLALLLAWHKQQRFEGDLALRDEVGLCHWSILVLGDRLVELFILSILDLLWLSSPDWLGLIAQLPVPGGFVHFLRLWLFLFLLLFLFPC